MKPRPWCSETVEDAEIWLRLLNRAPLEQGLLRFTMWNHYRTADRRDADLMLLAGRNPGYSIIVRDGQEPLQIRGWDWLHKELATPKRRRLGYVVT